MPRERPAAQLHNTSVERGRHPRIEIGMVVKELPRRGEALTSIRCLASQKIVEAGERRQHRAVRLDGCCGDHRPITARAAANSVAIVSDDKCT